MLSKLREFPEGLTAEDTMRRLVGDRQSFSAAAVRSTLARLIKVLDEDSDITVSETIRIQWQLHVPSLTKAGAAWLLGGCNSGSKPYPRGEASMGRGRKAATDQGWCLLLHSATVILTVCVARRLLRWMAAGETCR
jgi:hypothetical protein